MWLFFDKSEPAEISRKADEGERNRGAPGLGTRFHPTYAPGAPLGCSLHPPTPSVDLRSSTQIFQQVQRFLESPQAVDLTEADVKLYAVRQGREVVRRQFEEHLALRASMERRVRVVDEQGQARPVAHRSTRKLRTMVSTVAVTHLTHQAPEQACLAPLCFALAALLAGSPGGRKRVELAHQSTMEDVYDPPGNLHPGRARGRG